MTRTTPPTCLLRDQNGTAAIEFALISPILVLLFFGAVELSNLLIADSKLRSVAASLSDIITQETTGQIDLADLNMANTAAAQIMLPLPVVSDGSPRLAILITDYRPTSISAANVVWTRIVFGGGTNPTTASQLGLSNPACADTSLPVSLLPKSVSSPFNDVVRVRARYQWRPWFSMIFNSNITLESTNYNMPRYSLNLNPGADLTPPC